MSTMFFIKKFFSRCERVCKRIFARIFSSILLSCSAFFIVCFIGLSSLSFGMKGMQGSQGMASSQKGSAQKGYVYKSNTQFQSNMHQLDLEAQNDGLHNDGDKSGNVVNDTNNPEKISFQSRVYGKIIDSKKGFCDRLKSSIARFYRTSEEMEGEFRNYPLDKVYTEINKQQVRNCKLTFILKILDSLLIPGAISLIIFIGKQC